MDSSCIKGYWIFPELKDVIKLANTEILKILPIIKNALKVPTHNRLIVSKKYNYKS